MSPGSRTAWTPRSGRRASGSPAASGSASGWRVPWRPRDLDAPALLVLDDPFSAVDVATEAAIVASLRHAFGPEAPPEERVTIVLCSHRLAGFPYADLVLVLDRGGVVETGTHADLLAAGGLYARIYRAQRAAESPAVEPAAAMIGRRRVRSRCHRCPARRWSGTSWVCWRSGEASVALVGLLVLAAAAVELVPPLVIRDIVDRHLTVGRSGGLPALALLYLLGVAAMQALTFLYGYLAATVAQGVLSDLRTRLFAHLQRLPHALFRSRADRRRDQPLHRRRRDARHRVLVGRGGAAGQPGTPA